MIMDRHLGSSLQSVCAFLLCAILTLSVAQSLAQADSPQWMVVQSETEPARAGDQEIYYTVHEFKRGALVQTDGTSGNYTRVRYPATFSGFVSSRDAQPTSSGKSVQLTKPAQVSAVSLLSGFDGSWCPLYAEPLPTGTEMTVIEPMKDSRDQVVGYRVTPPTPPSVVSYPYAYIRTSALRLATNEEIRKHLNTDPVAEPVEQANAPVVEPAQVDPEPVKDAIDDTIEGAEESAEQPAQQPTQRPAQQPEVDLVDESEPVVITNTLPEVQTPEVMPPDKSGSSASPSHLSASSLEALEASFTNARSMPREQLDEALPELLAEFTRARDTAGDDEAAGPIDQRIEWLKLRIETRDQRRAIARTLSQADAGSLELNRKMDAWNNSRVYTMVGRLMTSGVYTGEHLPLLYRVRAPDRVTGIEHTVGYIAPSDSQDLRQYLGSIVGVVGVPVRDGALALTVLTPTRIDRMPNQ